jgi:hypothetical protein
MTRSGRLFDVQGQPARDVKVSVSALRRVPRRARDPDPEDFDGPAFWWAHPEDLPGWPRPVTTGSDGRFTVRGVGPGVRVYLSVHDLRFASQSIEVATDDASSAKPLTLALAPARTVTVRVTYADTGKPVPHAQVSITRFDQQQLGGGPRPIISETDAEGRFRANVGLGDHGAVAASPPSGQPYLAKFEPIDWPKGAVQHSVDVALPRGVMIRGRVVEQASGKPIAGAIVMASPHMMPNDPRPGRSRPVTTTADGSFELADLPRPGYLAVRDLSDDYVLQEMGSNLFVNGRPGGRRYYAHAFIACDPKPGGASPGVRIVLHRGVTVKGRVVGPDGQPVQDSWMFSRLHFGAAFRSSDGGAATGTAPRAAAGSSCTASIPTARFPSNSSIPITAWVRRPGSRASRRPASWSLCGSLPAARPRRGWPAPTGSRSEGSAIPG